MLDHTGVKCPVCGVPFGKDDDIVVCPECGAPYHRACYQKEGRCIFTDLHEQGKEWEPPKPPKAPDVSAEIKDRECPQCGTLNGHSALFCSRCGASLLGAPQAHSNTTGAQPPYGGQPRAVYGSTAPPFAFDPMGGVSPAESLDDGVTFGQVSKLVKQNTGYYMPVFHYIKRSGRNRFNFSAFLFSGAWMLYRKQYKHGAIVTALMFCLYLLFQCSYWLVSWPAMVEAAAQAGIANMSAESFLMLSEEQRLSISMALAQDGLSLFKLMLPFLFLLGIFICMIVVGVRGNRIYMNHCIRTARAIRVGGQDGDPGMTLDVKGGVNPMVSACVAMCYFVLRSVLPLLLI